MAMSNCKECGKAVSTLAKTCPSCGVPKPAKVLKKKTITKTKKEQEPTWVHCANHECNNYGEMSQIPSTALGHRICYNCNGYLIKGKPTMPRKRVKKKSKPDDNINTEWKIPPQIDYEIDPGSSGYAEYIKQNPDYKKKTKLQNTSGQKDAFQKFAEGDLDLATAFWGFGVVGSILLGVVTGFLSEAVSKNFVWGYVIVTGWIVISLWQCAETYKKEMTEQKQSIVWGILTQAYCVLGVFGLFNFIKDVW